MSNNELSIVTQTGSTKPGDKAEARITETGWQVLKVSKNNGSDKYSATRYKNGTVVETKTTKMK